MDFRRKKGHQKLTQLDRYLEQEAEHFRILPALKALIADTKEALAALPGWEKGFHIFWLLGPFVLLIERTPADIWLSLLVLVFVIRSIVKRDGTWLRPSGCGQVLPSGSGASSPVRSHLTRPMPWARRSSGSASRSLQWRQLSGWHATNAFSMRCWSRRHWG